MPLWRRPFRNCKENTGKKSSFSAIREERRKILLKKEFLNATKERRGHVEGEEERCWWRGELTGEGGCSSWGEEGGEGTPLPPSYHQNSATHRIKFVTMGKRERRSNTLILLIVHLQNRRYFENWKALPFPKSLSWQLIIIWQISTSHRKKLIIGRGRIINEK